MELTVAAAGVLVAMVASILSYLTVRQSQMLTGQQHAWEAARVSYDRQAEAIENALAACDDLVQHAYRIEQYWRSDPLAMHSVPNGLGPGALSDGHGDLLRTLTTADVYGTEVEAFFRDRHRLLLWSHRIQAEKLRVQLQDFYKSSQRLLRFRTIEEGREVRSHLYTYYLEMMEAAGFAVSRMSEEAEWPPKAD